MPGNIRQAEHFLGFMRRFNQYMKVKNTDLMWVSNWSCDMPDSATSPASCGGDPNLLPPACPADCLHRQEAPQVHGHTPWAAGYQVTSHDPGSVQNVSTPYCGPWRWWMSAITLLSFVWRTLPLSSPPIPKVSGSCDCHVTVM